MPQHQRPADERPNRPTKAAETERPEDHLESGEQALTEDELEESAAGRRAASVSEPAEEQSMSVAPEETYPRIGGVTPLPSEPPFYTKP